MATELEPWLTGTHADVDPVQRAVLHALELADRDVSRWALALDEQLLRLRPYGLPSVAFQVRHIARSLDRLFTYAEGSALSPEQLNALATEQEEFIDAEVLRAEFQAAMQSAQLRLLRFHPAYHGEQRTVGRNQLPTTVAGLLIHIAEHTQRHVGQAITTAKLAQALHGTEQS